jgi:hemerythrin-like domain-containing protein
MKGSLWQNSGFDLVRQLVREHDQFLHDLDELVRMVGRAVSDGRVPETWARLGEMLPLVAVDLDCHARFEVDHLFGRMRRNGFDLSVLGRLLAEHDSICDTADAFNRWATARMEGQDRALPTWVALTCRLRKDFAEHAHEEDTVFFPHARQLVPPQELLVRAVSRKT